MRYFTRQLYSKSNLIKTQILRDRVTYIYLCKLFGDDKVCVFCALTLVGALFIFSGATMKILLLFIALILILPLIGRKRYGKSGYWNNVLMLLGYLALLVVLIVVVAILKI